MNFREAGPLPTLGRMLQNPYQTLKAAHRLPTPPGVALRILQIVQSEHASLDDLTQVISADPALVARILKYIGSPAFGLGLAGATLPEAVSRIGLRGVQTLALSFSLVSQQHRQGCPSFAFDGHWAQSLARAVAARHLATMAGGWNPDDAFITGLVCRIGQLVFATGFSAEYERVLRGATHANLPLEEREQEVLGADHFTIGMTLLKEWQLPETVWQTTGALSPTQGGMTGNRPAAILRLADAIAAFLGDETRQNQEVVNTLVDTAHLELELESEAFRALLGRTGEEWTTLGRMLAVATGQVPDLAVIERNAEEQRTTLRLAAEMEISSLRNENEQLSRIAHRDRLTGLHNRRAFDDALPVAIERARAAGQPLALLIADVDHFKQINDAHGHPAGDAVLRHLACVLNDHVRAKEQVFRYGGEEFAVIATDRSLEGALALAETLRAAVEATPWQENAKTIPFTISVGIAGAQWPERPAEPADLIDIADQRLYDAKRTGRNRCCAEAPSSAGRWNPAAQTPGAKSGGGGLLKKLGWFLPNGRK